MSESGVKEFVSGVLANPRGRHTRENKPVGHAVGTVGVRRAHVNESIVVAVVIAPDIHERWTAETVGECPGRAGPGRSVVAAPGELRVAHVAHPKIEHA